MSQRKNMQTGPLFFFLFGGEKKWNASLKIIKILLKHLIVPLEQLFNMTDICLSLMQKSHRIYIVPNSEKCED